MDAELAPVYGLRRDVCTVWIVWITFCGAGVVDCSGKHMTVRFERNGMFAGGISCEFFEIIPLLRANLRVRATLRLVAARDGQQTRICLMNWGVCTGMKSMRYVCFMRKAVYLDSKAVVGKREDLRG